MALAIRREAQSRPPIGIGDLPTDSLHRVLCFLALDASSLEALHAAVPALRHTIDAFRNGERAFPMPVTPATEHLSPAPSLNVRLDVQRLESARGPTPPSPQPSMLGESPQKHSIESRKTLTGSRQEGPNHGGARIRTNARGQGDYPPTDLFLEKGGLPSHAHAHLAAPLSCYSAHWRIDIVRFRGRAIEVGVTARRHSAFVVKDQSVFFDCAGRISVCGCRQTYGRTFTAGESVGVVYDASTNSLLFLDDGMAMGPPISLDQLTPGCKPGDRRASGGHAGTVDVRRRKGELWAYVKFGNVPGDAVHVRSGRSVRCIAGLADTYSRWRRPIGRIEEDGQVVVVTWNDCVWYAMPLDPMTHTLNDLRLALATRTNLKTSEIELIMNRRRLEDDSATLRELGIVINPRTGSHDHDILLSVPHLVS